MNTSVNEIFNELESRGIAVRAVELSDGGTMLLFEYGGKQRAISGTSPDLTSATGRTAANNKYVSHVIAEHIGMPLPHTAIYDNDDQAAAFLAANQTIVIKPLNGAHGNGVTTNVRTHEQLTAALQRAGEVSNTILMQQQVSGNDLRILVIDGRLAAATERVPAAVAGDGRRTVRELIEHENATNPLRGDNYEKPMNRIAINVATIYLGESGMQRIPAADEQVQVVGTANIGTGGSAIDRTQQVPQALVNAAERFADAIGAYVCGVDFLYDGDRQTWHFIEANTSPSFGLHLWPTEGEGVNVTDIFVTRLLASYDKQDGESTVIGRNTIVHFVGHATDVPAKVDTGADRSALWASNIEIADDHALRFTLFDPSSSLYTGEIISTNDYKVSKVRSSSGHMQIRYRVRLPVVIRGRQVLASFTLADRSANHFPVLIGRRTLAGKFFVDVSRAEYEMPRSRRRRHKLNDELIKNPRAFYEKYHANDDESDKVKK